MNAIYKQFVILNTDNTLTWLDVVAVLFVTMCRYIVKFDNKLNKWSKRIISDVNQQVDDSYLGDHVHAHGVAGESGEPQM